MQYTTASGKKMLYSSKTYCYLSVQSSLKLLHYERDLLNVVSHGEIENVLRMFIVTYMMGKFGKKFINPNRNNFLTEKYNYALTINLDWFCAYKHVKSYYIGVIYGVINNLLRSERFKRENLLIIGIVPSMAKEPPVLTFIVPFVEEMTVA